jgi:type VI secretion system secreted protein Hcp
MAVDYFLKVEGIPGESLDARHKDEIDVLGFDWGVSQEGRTRTGSDGASGKAVWDTKKNAKG